MSLARTRVSEIDSPIPDEGALGCYKNDIETNPDEKA